MFGLVGATGISEILTQIGLMLALGFYLTKSRTEVVPCQDARIEWSETNGMPQKLMECLGLRVEAGEAQGLGFEALGSLGKSNDLTLGN